MNLIFTILSEYIFYNWIKKMNVKNDQDGNC